jgi:hypothetical protein
LKNKQYILRNLDRNEYLNWDQFVRNSTSGTLFHLTTWADTIQSVFKRSYTITVLMKNDKIESGILYWSKGGAIPAITNVALTPYQGILHATPDSTKKKSSVNADIEKQTNLLLEFLNKQYPFINFPLSIGIDDTRYYKWNNFTVEPTYTYLIELNSEEDILARFNQSLRRKINLSKKQDLSIVRSDDTIQISQFIWDSYKTHKTTPPIGSEEMLSFLKEILKKDIGRIYYLQKDGKFVCGIVILIDNNHIYALFSGINTKFRDTQYTQYLHASILLLPEFRGKTFDFLGANTKHLEQFKRGFGGKLQPFYRVLYYKNILTRSVYKFRSFQHQSFRKILRFVK